MLQLIDESPFASNMVVLPNESGVDTLYIITKATFKIGKQWTLAEEQLPPQVADEYWAEPGQSSIKMASDFHLGKPTSDVIILGHACAPQKKSVDQLDVSASVGEVSKTLRVWGDRKWQNGKPSRPDSFTTMPIVYERAFGGVCLQGGIMKSIEERNPVGRGYIGERTADEIEGLLLPNIEDPEHLIETPSDNPAPGCFAYTSPHWLPRVGFVGTYDERWQNERAPFLPEDFDRRFFNLAHSDLTYPSYLQGGEKVYIKNMHPAGDLNFSLPMVKLKAHVTIDKSIYAPEFNLETITIETTQLRLSMVWKASIECDKKVLKIKDVIVKFSR